jgi:hypothetical protein
LVTRQREVDTTHLHVNSDCGRDVGLGALKAKRRHGPGRLGCSASAGSHGGVAAHILRRRLLLGGSSHGGQLLRGLSIETCQWGFKTEDSGNCASVQVVAVAPPPFGSMG